MRLSRRPWKSVLTANPESSRCSPSHLSQALTPEAPDPNPGDNRIGFLPGQATSLQFSRFSRPLRGVRCMATSSKAMAMGAQVRPGGRDSSTQSQSEGPGLRRAGAASAQPRPAPPEHRYPGVGFPAPGRGRSGLRSRREESAQWSAGREASSKPRKTVVPAWLLFSCFLCPDTCQALGYARRMPSKEKHHCPQGVCGPMRTTLDN